MKYLYKYEIKDDELIKTYSNFKEKKYTYDLDTEIKTLKELKDSVVNLTEYTENIDKIMLNNLIHSIAYSVLSLFTLISFLSDIDIYKIIFFIICMINAVREIFKHKKNEEIKQVFQNVDIEMLYQSKLFKSSEKTNERTTVRMAADLDGLERKHLEHLKYIREALEEETKELKDDDIYIKEYKIL